VHRKTTENNEKISVVKSSGSACIIKQYNMALYYTVSPVTTAEVVGFQQLHEADSRMQNMSPLATSDARQHNH